CLFGVRWGAIGVVEKAIDRLAEGRERRVHALEERGVGRSGEGKARELPREARGEALDLVVSSMRGAAGLLDPRLELGLQPLANARPIELDGALPPGDGAGP